MPDGSAPAIDVLSDVLSTARLRSTVLGRVDLRSPWALSMQKQPRSVFHLVLDGHCWLTTAGSKPRQAARGDVLLMPRGKAHLLRDAERSKAKPRAFAALSGPPVSDGAGDVSRILHGAFVFEDQQTNLLLDGLPEVVHVEHLESEVRPWLEQTLNLIDHESRALEPGSKAALSGLCDALFIYVLRHQLAQATRTGWLRALAEPGIADALKHIHAQPQSDWTVQSLARHAGMSRSKFADRFRGLVGQSPEQYLLSWRLRKAASRLRDSHDSIAEIASLAGYESEAAFNKAFKRELRATPGVYRDRAPRSEPLGSNG